MKNCPSGRQIGISWGDQRAIVVEVGAGSRCYELGDRPVFGAYPIDTMCDGGHGPPLIPWPNPMADGQYRFDGNEYLVALSEPEKRNAIHGPLPRRAWQVMHKSAAGVTMEIRLHPMEGYPFPLNVEVDYALVSTARR